MATQAELLEDALRSRKMSARRCGTLIAGAGDTKPENARRSVQRWLAGEGISDENAERLAVVLSYPPDYFKKPPREHTHPWHEEAAALRETVKNLEQRIRSLELRRPPLPPPR